MGLLSRKVETAARRRTASASGQSGGMSPWMVALLGMLAYKAVKGGALGNKLDRTAGGERTATRHALPADMWRARRAGPRNSRAGAARRRRGGAPAGHGGLRTCAAWRHGQGGAAVMGRNRRDLATRRRTSRVR